jgi:hypothetical protein
MANGRDEVQRSILPIPDRARVLVTTYDARNPHTKFPPIKPPLPPKGALGLDINLTWAGQPLPAATHQVRAEFTYDGGGAGKGGEVALFYDGVEVGRGRLPHTQPLGFSAEETTDIGYESGSVVAPDYPTPDGRFMGKIHWVQLNVGNDNFSHLVTPEERLRLAMASQ